MDDFQMDVPDFEMGGVGLELDNGGRDKSVAGTDRSRMTTPAADGMPLEDGDETYADATCPIAMFDVRPSSQTQGTDKDAEAIDNEGKGYSKNTVKALGIIRKDLQPAVGGEIEDKVISFRKMSDKACQLYVCRVSAPNHFFRRPDVLLHLSSLNYLCSALVTASNSHKLHHLGMSKSVQKTSCGNVNDMTLSHPLDMGLLHLLVVHP
jgi:hypothetical protein